MADDSNSDDSRLSQLKQKFDDSGWGTDYGLAWMVQGTAFVYHTNTDLATRTGKPPDHAVKVVFVNTGSGWQLPDPIAVREAAMNAWRSAEPKAEPAAHSTSLRAGFIQNLQVEEFEWRVLQSKVKKELLILPACSTNKKEEIRIRRRSSNLHELERRLEFLILKSEDLQEHLLANVAEPNSYQKNETASDGKVGQSSINDLAEKAYSLGKSAVHVYGMLANSGIVKMSEQQNTAGRVTKRKQEVKLTLTALMKEHHHTQGKYPNWRQCLSAFVKGRKTVNGTQIKLEKDDIDGIELLLIGAEEIAMGTFRNWVTECRTLLAKAK